MACGGHMKAGDGAYKYPAGVHKPEYETMGAFGSMCLNTNLDSITMANEICNLHGLDTISAGCTIAFAIECFENEIITKGETDGIELTWGNHEAIIAMTEKMAKREGFGDVLADGSKAAAQKIGKGAENYAIQIQGQELPMHDPRGQIRAGLGATYKAAPNPSRHTRASGEGEFRNPFMEPVSYDQDSFEKRGPDHKLVTDHTYAVSSGGFCLFGYIVMPVEAAQDFINAVTGWDLNFDDTLKIGERIANIQQAFNIREGLNPLKFKVPSRVHKPPVTREGPLAGKHCDIDTMVRDWYAEMDWDTGTGKPSRKKLEELGLKDVAEALYP